MPIQVTDLFWNHFISYLINKAGLRVSSTKTLCAQLRAILAWAQKHNCPISQTYDIIQLPTTKTTKIALTQDEVSHIYHFNLDSLDCRSQLKATLEKVRDHFVLACSLGQRNSDLIRIDPSCFDRNIFTIMQKKTCQKCKVDLDRMSMDKTTTYKILRKYDYRAPFPHESTIVDRYIKILLKFIGQEFNEPVRIDQKIGSVLHTDYIPKHQLISSHTGRRTFATVNILRGYSESEVRRATGHKTGESFERYICYGE